MFELSVIHPGVEKIWRENLDRLPPAELNYMRRAADMLVIEMSNYDPAVKMQIVRVWLQEVANLGRLVRPSRLDVRSLFGLVC